MPWPVKLISSTFRGGGGGGIREIPSSVQFTSGVGGSFMQMCFVIFLSGLTQKLAKVFKIVISFTACFNHNKYVVAIFQLFSTHYFFILFYHLFINSPS